jgi:hypothetical protein
LYVLRIDALNGFTGKGMSRKRALIVGFLFFFSTIAGAIQIPLECALRPCCCEKSGEARNSAPPEKLIVKCGCAPSGPLACGYEQNAIPKSSTVIVSPARNDRQPLSAGISYMNVSQRAAPEWAGRDTAYDIKSNCIGSTPIYLKTLSLIC